MAAQKTRWHATQVVDFGGLYVSLRRLDQVLNGPVVYDDDNVTFTGTIIFTGGVTFTGAFTVNPGPLIVGAPANHVNALVRMGGAGASVANLEASAGGRIDWTLWDTSAAADDRRVDLFSLNGVSGPGSLAIGVTRTDAAASPQQLIQALHAGTVWTQLRLLPFGAGTVLIGNGSGVFITSDPGGTENFRVNGTTRLAGATVLSTGDFTLTTGRVIFSAAAGRILMGATSLTVRDSGDTANILGISALGALTLTGTSAELVLNTRSGGGTAWELYAPTTASFRLYHAGDQYSFTDTEFMWITASKTLGLSGTRWGKLWGVDADFSSTVLVTGDLTAGARLVFTTAVGKIVPGATSLSHRNAADSADNLLITDAGLATFRNTVNLSAGVLQMAGTQVVTTRRTGYTNAMTGTANRATAYDTSTITLVQLAERVKALLDDQTTHGLIGV